ncbi:transcription factor E2F8 [Cuculus canorus]|uniref:transcription factor E2F8 n=1 Tax=Cuculus canorus TaxID=55661 RepID=UPI0023AA524F|nr:transcription factor E2F8 [Cuculus canorus]
MQQAGGGMGSSDKENHSSEPYRNVLKTPLKQTATSHSVLREIQPDCQHLTTPPKPKKIPPADPWTPTWNLKMLVSAASPEIRSREQRRELSNNTNEVPQAKHCLQEHLSGDECEKSQPSRKEKSLGLLCQKFLARYPDYPSTENNFICLDEVAEELNVERRRIYDIVNVLESLHMVSRLAKNRYVWYGRHNLFKTLQALKKAGEENKYTRQIQMIKKREYENEFDFDGERNKETARYFNSSEPSEMSFVELPGTEFHPASVNGRKVTSLRVMSQKFVMLFLVSTPQVVSLEVAAKILIGEDRLEDLDKSKFKTKIRRLYDITNVLSSLELIKKVHVTKRGRKPAFKWTGPEVLPDTRGTDHHLSAFPSKTAHVPAIATHQLEGQSKKARVLKMKLSQSALECTLSSPEVVPKPEAPLSTGPTEQVAITQPLGACSPSHSAVSPVILPHTPSGVPYAMYLHPSQTHTVTTYSPGFMLQPLSCANVTGIKSINSKILNEVTTEEGDSQTATDDPTKSLTTQERLPTKSETSPQRGLKRSHALQENNLVKRFRSDEKSLDTSLGECSKNETPPSNSSQMNHGMDNFQEEGQNTTETLYQNKTFFPSGCLIPLTHYIHSNKEGFSNKEKDGICSSQRTTHSSPVTGIIPGTTSELKAVNIPAFHITPLNIMLSPTSIGAAPVVSNSCLNSSNTSSVQNPSPSFLNFALQHIGLLAAGVQVPSNPVLQHMPVPSQPESVSHSSENMHLQEKPCVPREPQEPQAATENFFRTPGRPNTASSLSANSNGTDRMSQRTLYIPQQKLEVSKD